MRVIDLFFIMPEPAAESSSGETSIWSLVLWIILLYALGTALDRVPKNIQARTGIDIFHPIESVRHVGELSALTPLGTRVATITGTDVFSAPMQGTLIGFQPSEVLGKLRGGPETVQDARWWDVDFETGPDGWVAERALESRGPGSWFAAFISSWTVIAFIISFIAFTLLIYFTIRTNQIRAREYRKLRAQLPEQTTSIHNERWERVTTHVSSDNPNDWRLAIIEADVILDELVTRMGYRGASLGDKLKQVEPADFVSLDAAWEAHKTRNRIAHSGSDFILTQREARRIIDLYAQVFKEFHYL